MDAMDRELPPWCVNGHDDGGVQPPPQAPRPLAAFMESKPPQPPPGASAEQLRLWEERLKQWEQELQGRQTQQGKGKNDGGKAKGKGGKKGDPGADCKAKNRLDTPQEFRDRWNNLPKMSEDFCIRFQKPPVGNGERKIGADVVPRCLNDKCTRVHKDMDPINKIDFAAAMETAQYMKDIAEWRANNRAKMHVLPGLDSKGTDGVYGAPRQVDGGGYQRPPGPVT